MANLFNEELKITSYEFYEHTTNNIITLKLYNIETL